METLKTENIKLSVNGIIVPATLKIKIENEQESVEGDFDFGDAKENAKYLKRFERGELLLLCVFVEVIAEGERGIDSLGMCHIKANNAESDVMDLVKDYGMVENAKQDCIDSIVTKAKRLVHFANAGGR